MTDEGNITDADIRAVAARTRSLTFNALTMDEHLDLMRAVEQGFRASRVSPAGEPVTWVVLLRYGEDRWSGEMLTDVLPADNRNYKIVRPLYTAAPSYADAIRDAAKVAREHTNKFIPGSHAAYGYGIAKAIEALTHGSPL